MLCVSYSPDSTSNLYFKKGGRTSGNEKSLGIIRVCVACWGGAVMRDGEHEENAATLLAVLLFLSRNTRLLAERLRRSCNLLKTATP